MGINEDVMENLTFSSDLEKALYEYNSNLEDVNEDVIAKGRVIYSRNKIKIVIKKILRKLLFISWGNFPIAFNFFQNKLISVLVANRDILIQQNRNIDSLNAGQNSIKSELEKREALDRKENKHIAELENRISELSKLCEHGVNEQQNVEGCNDNELYKTIGEMEKGESCNDVKLQKDYSYALKEYIKLQKKKIIIFCAGLQKYEGLEAIRNEAYDTYLALKKSKKFNVTLMSLEKQNLRVRDDIVYVSRECVKDQICEIDPECILIIESLPLIALDFNGVFYNYRTIVKITSQNPIQGLTEKQLDELRHGCDYGVFHFVVESAYAKQILNENGFMGVEIIFPVVSRKRYKFSEVSAENERKIIGVASAPVIQEQFEGKGINLLKKVIPLCKNVDFTILWRNREVPIPYEIENADNCEIIYGKADMNLFYKKIDALLLPYASVNDNHACSLSVIEAIAAKKPVIVSTLAGASELVKRINAGLLCEPNVESICNTINFLSQNYKEIISKRNEIYWNNIFSSEKIENYVEKICSEYFPHEFITIENWDNILKKDGRYLVKGHDSIKKYYQNQDVAEDYNFNRFIEYPGNCYDVMERSSISVIFGDYFENRREPLSILDIACGDGRIIQENIKWGHCTALDGSEAMLNIVKNRFNGESNLYTLHKDFFEDEIDGQFDVVTTFRYIRHYDGIQRKYIYQKIRKCLKNNGILVFDVCNMEYSMIDRKKAGWTGFNIYDVFWTKDSIRQELEENGFKILYLLPIEIEKLGQGPVTWTVAATKK